MKDRTRNLLLVVVALMAAIPGLLEFAGKRAILRIVFVNEDLLVG
ncbi:MAG: hypothetical protein O2820_03305 [Planctomycetota bacterium]|nr:hypothetical protein [Planctomycetota bacterium]MDA1248229.1 hypothetical protein [Planctomycetota bacterium]